MKKMMLKSGDLFLPVPVEEKNDNFSIHYLYEFPNDIKGVIDSLDEGDLLVVDHFYDVENLSYDDCDVCVGEWINGKPLYRCSCSVTISSYTLKTWTSFYTFPSSLDIYMVHFHEAIMTVSNGNVYRSPTISYYGNAGGLQFKIRSNASGLRYYVGLTNTNYNGGTIEAIFYYTKNADY